MSGARSAEREVTVPEPPSDVIAVLGYNTDPTNPVTVARVTRAVELWRDGVAPFILMTGRCSVRHLDDPPTETEAEVMRDLAVSLGVPREQVLVETKSVNTIGNAYWAKVETLIPRGWRRVAVVSTEGHAELGAWLFERVCGPGYAIRAYPAPWPGDAEQRGAALERGGAAREEYGRACAAFADGDHEAFRAVLEI
jgi:hypothetical protein